MRILKIVIGLFLVALIAVSIYFYPRLPILTGYAAKMACSCTYISEESEDQIENQDLSFFPISLASVKFDKVAKTTTGSLLGLKPMTAEYRKGLGCVISSNNKIPKQTFEKNSNPSYQGLDTLNFPYGSKDLKAFTANINKESLNQAFQKAFDEEGAFDKRTRALLVMHKDTLVKEQYAPGFDEESKLLGWSMTKSICNTLFGMLVKEGKINIHDKAPIENWQKDERKEISMHHLLQMQSGLQWDENYFNWSDVTAMLYTEPSAYKTAINVPSQFTPGSHWYYSSGTTNILSGILRKQFNSHQDYLDFPHDKLFTPLGINADLETDAEGNYILSSYGFMSARDWAKLGQLYLNNGNWNGQQLLTEEWVKYSTTPAAHADNGIYGAQIWLNTNGAMFDKAPHDMYYFSGFQGQYVFVIPSKDLVIVRIGLAYLPELMNEVIGEIVESL